MEKKELDAEVWKVLFFVILLMFVGEIALKVITCVRYEMKVNELTQDYIVLEQRLSEAEWLSDDYDNN